MTRSYYREALTESTTEVSVVTEDVQPSTIKEIIEAFPTRWQQVAARMFETGKLIFEGKVLDLDRVETIMKELQNYIRDSYEDFNIEVELPIKIEDGEIHSEVYEMEIDTTEPTIVYVGITKNETLVFGLDGWYQLEDGLDFEEIFEKNNGVEWDPENEDHQEVEHEFDEEVQRNEKAGVSIEYANGQFDHIEIRQGTLFYKVKDYLVSKRDTADLILD